MSDKPLFDPTPEVQPVLDAAAEGRLAIQRCAACGHHQFYPRVHCTACGALDPEWVDASGDGEVHTFSVVHRNGMPGWRDEVPYVVAVIELAEGPRIFTNVVDCDPAEIAVGMPVRVTFVEEGELTLPKFGPA